ncbi:hypothetical protein HK097_004698 [Rhizophlyctis rosea]|uniref:DUF155 domain-containing protein n=1 Tax=Rhizophlyctis rosea TaxID=64517 RepID=A0AAD5S265_9FUNG|nr:hypothetical protein HK097_004698 [Rhizophlyctis rosea]
MAPPLPHKATRNRTLAGVIPSEPSPNRYPGPASPRQLNHNPYIDSFPRTSRISPYGQSFPPGPTQNPPRSGVFNPNRTPNRPRPNAPTRTTKTTQKLVLFPEEKDGLRPPIYQAPTEVTGEGVPWYAGYNEVVVPDVIPDAARTNAERTSKDRRLVIPRVTSYCIAEGYKIKDVLKHLELQHGIMPKLYDECLYAYYNPADMARVFGSTENKPLKMTADFDDRPQLRSPGLIEGAYTEFPVGVDGLREEYPNDSPEVDMQHSIQPLWMLRSEVFVFDYGVAVLWNFTKEEEKQFLTAIDRYTAGIKSAPGDVESEDFHFQYDLSGPYQPRIFNDMITLKSSSQMIKLTISHGLAQSVKLASFENIMEETIEGTIPLPRMMAKYGEVKMQRTDVMKIIGKLYKLRMNVNLVSNVLDTPELFWSEPQLEGLYNAIRGYLEINSRAKLLNTRADVISDLLDMLSEHMNSREMTYITWIIIILICIAVVVAIGEVWVKALRAGAGMEP